MLCGVACLEMVCASFGRKLSQTYLNELCHPTSEGVSLKGIADASEQLGLKSYAGYVTLRDLLSIETPCILHWDQAHFVVLYGIDHNGKRFWIADPGKGKYHLPYDEFIVHWSSMKSETEEKGIAMFFEPGENFYRQKSLTIEDSRSFSFLWQYILEYKKYFIQILFGLLLGCALQLVMPFLTQWIVDIGINHNDIKLIWLILLGELMIVIGRTSADFIRRWLLLHISMRVNISLISDFL